VHDTAIHDHATSPYPQISGKAQVAAEYYLKENVTVLTRSNHWGEEKCLNKALKENTLLRSGP
jgi:hypothetical protein